MRNAAGTKPERDVFSISERLVSAGVPRRASSHRPAGAPRLCLIDGYTVWVWSSCCSASTPEAREQIGCRRIPNLDLEEEIKRLKRERNAVILAHYYQDGEIQDLADYIGDSLQLAQAAKKTARGRDRVLRRALHGRDREDPEPARTVVIPDLNAGCSLAAVVRPTSSAPGRLATPAHVTISYINCSPK